MSEAEHERFKKEEVDKLRADLDHEKVEKLEMEDRVEKMEKNQARILELIEMGAKVDPGLLQLRKEDLPK